MSSKLIKLSALGLYGITLQELKTAITEAEYEANGEDVILEGSVAFFVADDDLNKLFSEEKELEIKLAEVKEKMEKFRRTKRDEKSTKSV